MSCHWSDDSKSFFVGYIDGVIKVFCVSDRTCTKTIKVGSGMICSMETNDPKTSSIWALDRNNFLHSINFKATKLESSLQVHSGCTHVSKCLKKSNDGKSMATSGDCDNLVKVWNIESRSEMWANKLGGRCTGISWVPGDTYLITITLQPNKVVIVSPRDGKTLMEFTTGFTTLLHSLVVSFKSKMILVGDVKGHVHELKMVE